MGSNDRNLNSDMPELPEVETIVKGLRPKIVGKQIISAQILLPKIVWLDTIQATGNKETDQVKALVEAKTIQTITRRGKMIIMELSGGVIALLHLKMTGQLIYISSTKERYAGGHSSPDLVKDLPTKSTRVVFQFEDKSTLYFNDQRQFGYLKIMTPAQYLAHLESLKFGPEALSSEFNGAYLYQVAQKRPKITIKQLILDQHVVAGVGNIYADESLFNTQIHPAAPANTLSSDQVKSLVGKIKEVLEFSIAHNGTSSEHYVTSTGEQGDMQNYLKVYRKDGQPCPRCGNTLHRMTIGGRGTHYCPNCQKL